MKRERGRPRKYPELVALMVGEKFVIAWPATRGLLGSPIPAAAVYNEIRRAKKAGVVKRFRMEPRTDGLHVTREV